MEFDLEDNPVGDDSRPSYAERYIHAVIYAARPDIRAVAPGHRKPIHSQSQTHRTIGPDDNHPTILPTGY